MHPRHHVVGEEGLKQLADGPEFSQKFADTKKI